MKKSLNSLAKVTTGYVVYCDVPTARRLKRHIVTVNGGVPLYYAVNLADAIDFLVAHEVPVATLRAGESSVLVKLSPPRSYPPNPDIRVLEERHGPHVKALAEAQLAAKAAKQ